MRGKARALRTETHLKHNKTPEDKSANHLWLSSEVKSVQLTTGRARRPLMQANDNGCPRKSRSAAKTNRPGTHPALKHRFTSSRRFSGNKLCKFGLSIAELSSAGRISKTVGAIFLK